jgi:ABC-2 type transport system permease protein
MTVMSASAVLPVPESRVAPSVLRMCALETRYAFIGLLRLPHYSMATIGFPVMFYLLFGLSFGNRGGGLKASEYLLAGYAVFGMITAALFAFGAGVANERASGWLLLKQAAPLPAWVYLTAKVVTCMIFGLVILAFLAILGVAFGGVHFTPQAWLQLASVVALGCIPFCLIGLALGCVIPPSGAPGIVNLINLPLAFAGGLWMPYEMLPKVLQAIAPFVPQYHVGRLALISVGLVNEPAFGHLVALTAIAVLAGLCAAAAYRRASREF